MLGIVFDVDDTLYEQLLPFEKAAKKIVKQNINIEKFYHLSRYYSDLKFEDSRDGTMTMEEYYIYRVQQAASDLGVLLSDEEALNFQKEYKKNQGQLEVPTPLKKLLDELSENKNIKLGVITNGPSDHQWFKVRTLGLEKWIEKENIIVSYDLGINKPAKEIFEEMERRLELEEKNLIYVGDSLENDIVGANNAKWRAVWVNRYENDAPKSLNIYKEVKNSEELAAVIKELVKNNGADLKVLKKV